VTVTGSVRAGKAIGAQAGAALKKCVLELGGSDPFIVLNDADLDEAVKAAVTGRYQNTGRCAPRRNALSSKPALPRPSPANLSTPSRR
jgi:acyl-CoA reductase-like NAD-dependent aldehyde dehydrogenase